MHNCHLLYITKGDRSQETLTGQKQSDYERNVYANGSGLPTHIPRSQLQTVGGEGFRLK